MLKKRSRKNLIIWIVARTIEEYELGQLFKCDGKPDNAEVLY